MRTRAGFLSMPSTYNKPALTIDQQIDLLESRGLIVPEWTARLYDLLKSHTFINPTRMGFTTDWRNDSFWGVKY